jgi:hypothetical protein
MVHLLFAPLSIVPIESVLFLKPGIGLERATLDLLNESEIASQAQGFQPSSQRLIKAPIKLLENNRW